MLGWTTLEVTPPPTSPLPPARVPLDAQLAPELKTWMPGGEPCASTMRCPSAHPDVISVADWVCHARHSFHYAPHTIRRPVELIMRDIAVHEEARAAKLDKEVNRLFPR